MKKLLTIAAALAAGGILSSASASTVFVFKGNGGNVTPEGTLGTDFVTCASGGANQDFCSAALGGDHTNGLLFERNSIEVRAIAHKDHNADSQTMPSDNTAVRIIQDRTPGDSGLGAFSENNSSDDQTQFESGEAILFDLRSNGRDFTITDVEFNAGGDVNCTANGGNPGEGPCGKFRLQIWDINDVLTLDTMIDILASTSLVGGQDILPILGTGAKFLLTALDIDPNNPGGFAIAQFKVNEIPVPGALPLMLLGLGGLGFAARRKSKGAATV
ncbi:MAG: PEP-CTERM sorting domain-containing protein [Pseudomonadota bacterium]